MISGEFEGLNEVLHKLTKLHVGLVNSRPMFRFLGQAVLYATQEAFEAEEDPWGIKWRPLAPFTLSLREKRGITHDIIHLESGELYKSFGMTFGQDEVTVGTSKWFAPLLQFGGQASIRGRIPPRPMLPITPDGDVELPNELYQQFNFGIETYLKRLGE